LNIYRIRFNYNIKSVDIPKFCISTSNTPKNEKQTSSVAFLILKYEIANQR
jgi:hypothetical protein